MEYWLSLDLSSKISSFSLHHSDDDKVVLLEEYVFPEIHKQSEQFIPQLSLLLDRQKVALKQITRFITTKGPGSFTGMRIAFSSIKAFCQVFGSQVDLVDGSEAIALRWLSEHADRKVAVVTRIATEKFFVGYFHGKNKISEELVAKVPEIKDYDVLINERRPVDSEKSILFPLRSTYLAETLLNNQSRETYATWAEISTLQPLYLGDTKFSLPTATPPHARS